MSPNMVERELPPSVHADNLASLLEGYRPELRAYAMHLLGSHRCEQDVEDMVQETFLHALMHLPSLRHPAALRSWLHTILRNNCYLLLRRSRQQPLSWEQDVQETITVTQPLLDEVSPDSAQVWAAMELLPDALNATVLLRFFRSRRSYQQIATILGIPVGTVRSRLHHACKRLRAIFPQLSGEAGMEACARNEQQEERFRALLLAAITNDALAPTFWDEYDANLQVTFTAEGYIQRERGKQHLQQLFERHTNANLPVDIQQVVFSGKVCFVELCRASAPATELPPPCVTMVFCRREERIIKAWICPPCW